MKVFIFVLLSSTLLLAISFMMISKLYEIKPNTGLQDAEFYYRSGATEKAKMLGKYLDSSSEAKKQFEANIISTY